MTKGNYGWGSGGYYVSGGGTNSQVSTPLSAYSGSRQLTVLVLALSAGQPLLQP